ncbi:hypothetical protein NQ318_020389 [Aromia moschata]|uniref:Uncharacterized protein n=1 Tax=Aromia moschata TaxID=1265417 RepID=A0AAV8Y3E8_9CUCU|nr:hypothetical protein NQ318_020389 [Aromia moschata]
MNPLRFRINEEPSQLDLVITNEINLLTPPLIESPVGKSDHAILSISECIFSEDAELCSVAELLAVVFYKFSGCVEFQPVVHIVIIIIIIIIKCEAPLPAELFHPVLLMKMNNKLMFVLCRTCGEEINVEKCTKRMNREF